jgi:ATP-binding cassette subfamily F protein 3
MLTISDLTYRVAGRTLLDGASVAVGKGRKVGLVGRNGTGKTTLLKLIAGDLAPDAGSVSVPPRWRVGTVAQEAPAGETPLIEAVLAADETRAGLMAEAETATDPHRIAEVHTRLAEIDAHAAPARAARILAGLGFPESAQAGPLKALSGGLRMRVALAALLFREPDLLLLDEPTNHLDLETTMWLEGYLARYPHTIVMVSHDRGLLNRAVDDIVHLEGGRLTLYGGNYDRFERTRAEALSRAEADRVKQATERAHIQAFVDRFRYKASKARQVQSRLKKLERMQPIAAAVEEPSIRFAFPDPGQLPPPLITLDRVAVGYGDRPVLDRVGLRLDQDDRIALLGANGNGKSTLTKLLAGRLAPMAGDMHRTAKLRTGYFAQHQGDELALDATVLQQAARVMPEATDLQRRNHLGRFGFTQERVETRVGSLSGGEKARLLFALISRDAPHLLLLDEPTNHLDIDSRQALVQAINAFEGAVVLVSHDPHLVDLTADRLLLVADGTVQTFDGDMDDYRRWLSERARRERTGAGTGTGTASGTETGGGTERRGDAASEAARGKEARRAAANARAQLAPLRRQAEAAERRLQSLGEARQRVEAALADPALYDGPAERITGLQQELHDLGLQIERLEGEWLELHMALEEADTARAG